MADRLNLTHNQLRENQYMQQLKSTTETWVNLEGYPDYQISNYGNVRSLDRVDRHRLLKSKMLSVYLTGGCCRVTLRKDGKSDMQMLNRLVAKTFVPNPDNLRYVIHLDRNKLNNQASNLCWSDERSSK
jgi:hypothetical protein